MRSRLNDNGSYGSGIRALEAYYKSPCAFALSGLLPEGRAVLRWLTDEYIGTGWRFQATAQDERYERYCDLYRDLWIAWGAHILGEGDLARSIFADLTQFQHRLVGGFCSSVSRSGKDLVLDIRSSALGGFVALLLGQADVAENAATFLLRMMELRTDAHALPLACDGLGRAVTTYPEKLERFYVIRTGQNRPLIYAPALAGAFLASFFSNTGNTAYLRGAREYFNVCMQHGPQALYGQYSGKVGWCAALLYSACGETSFRSTAQTVALAKVAEQRAQGDWVKKVAAAHDDPVLTIDATAESVVWLKLIAQLVAEEPRS